MTNSRIQRQIDRLLDEADEAASQRRWDDVRDHAQQALTFDPDERAEALEHLDFAIAEFQEMKMQPSLERALRHRDILKA